MHPRCSQAGAETTGTGDTALEEAEALRLDDRERRFSVKESRKGSCTYRMDGARKIDAAKASRKARAMKATAPVIKL